MPDQIRTTDALDILVRLARTILEERSRTPSYNLQNITEDLMIKTAADHVEKVVRCIKDGNTILQSISAAESDSSS